MKKYLLTQYLFTAAFLFGIFSAHGQCVILGDTSVCPSSTETYSIENPNSGEVYVWSVGSGGAIIGSNSGTSIDVQWGAVSGYNTLHVTIQTPGATQSRSQDFVTECIDFETNTISGPSPCAAPSDVSFYQNAGTTYIRSEGGAGAAYLAGTSFDNVSRCDVDGLTFGSLLPSNPFDGSSSVFIVRTAAGNYYKLGNAVSSATEVTYDWAMLSAECGGGSSCSQDVLIEGDPTLACNDLIHVSMDENCMAALTADMLLEGEMLPNSSYIVTVYDLNGNLIPNATLTSDYVGMTLSYRVTHECSGRTCWGDLLVEDKLIPDLECRVDTIEAMCGEGLSPEEVGFPLPIGVSAVRIAGTNTFEVIGFDPCGEVELSYTDDVVKNGCGEEYYTIITRTWKVRDGYGNETSCEEYIGQLPGSLANLKFPDNYDGIHKFALECDFRDSLQRGPSGGIGSPSVNIGWNSLSNGLPSPDDKVIAPGDTLIGTGRPMGVDCDHIAVSYRDRVIETCGPNTYKLFRMWRIYDWCTGESMDSLQLIKVTDTRAPQVLCPSLQPVTIVSMDPWNCTGSYVVPAPLYNPDATSSTGVPTIIRECSDWTYTVRHKVANISGDAPGDCINIPNSGAFYTTNVRQLSNGQYEVYDMPFGCNWIEYTIIDDCGNETTCRLDVFVEDEENPVAVCDEHTVVSLNEFGEAKLCAQVVDNGSSDNCTERDELEYAIKIMGEADSEFRNCIDFSCEDVEASPIMVVFRVYDKRGNYNDCMVEVTIQDKIAPSMDCPGNVVLDCEQDYTNNTLTGIPSVSDQCGTPKLSAEIIEEELNDCGLGYVVKRWRVEDAGGRFAICDQRIDIIDKTPFGTSNIVWPTARYTIDGCTESEAHPNNLPDGVGWPEYVNKGCAHPVAGYQDEAYYNVAGFCIQIQRTWEVIDWCQYDVTTNTGPKWTFVQIINVDNNNPPVIDEGCETSKEVCVGADCTGLVEFSLGANDDCTLDKDLEWKYTVRDLSDNSVIDEGSSRTYSETLTRGRYRFTWEVRDACGNTDQCSSTVTVKDCKEPTPYCKPGIITTIMPSTGYVEVWASDFNDGSYDNCTDSTDLIYSFSSNIADKVRQITCDSIDNGVVDTFYYQMWVTDGDGNQDYCEVTIIVQDNQDRCPDVGNTMATVAGLIQTEGTQEVRGVEVNLMHLGVKEKSMETQTDGRFTFVGLTMMDEYEVRPYKNDDYLNGVSTADLVMIQRHLLGLKELESPYQYIAADVNNNEEVSTADISELRKLILGAVGEFRNNTSWRFISKQQQFSQKDNPWLDPLQESVGFHPITHNMMDSDFMGVKVGDINGDVVANGTANGTRTRGLMLQLAQVDSKEGTTVAEIRMGEEMVLSGLQYTLELGRLTLEEVRGVALDIDASQYHYDEQRGIITMSWSHVEGVHLGAGEVLMSLNLSGSEGLSLSEELSMSSRVTKAEAYGEDLTPYELGMESEDLILEEGIGLKLYQNIPNPFKGSTIIPFELSKAAGAKLTIFDITGKTVLVVHLAGKKGYNEFELESDRLSSTGILYYQLESSQQLAIKKMINIE